MYGLCDKDRQSLVEQRFPQGLIVFFMGMCYNNIKYAQRIEKMIIWLVTGLWVLLGCAEAAHLITLITNKSLQTYTALCGIFVLAGLLAYIGIFVFWYRRNKDGLRDQRKFQASPYMVVFAILAGMTIFHFWKGYVPDLQDAVYEITIGNVHTNSIMSVHPFMGNEAEASMPMRMQILGLSSLYSALITVSQQSTYIIMCKVVPVIVWCFSILLFGLFAEKLFSENVHKRWLFLSLIAFLYIVTSGSEGLAGERLFYAGFSGETIRGVLLMPYTLYVCWQKKWLLAVLAVLAEVCLVWTTYGIGYCLLITVCMFLVHLLMDRRNRHAA